MLPNEIITVSLKVIGIWKVGSFIEMVELLPTVMNFESVERNEVLTQVWELLMSTANSWKKYRKKRKINRSNLSELGELVKE